jgi:hypothetical protein
MVREEFKKYMDQQIFEIKKYKEVNSKSGSDKNSNDCVFEWIRNNAKNFCDSWPKN